MMMGELEITKEQIFGLVKTGTDSVTILNCINTFKKHTQK